MDFFSLSKLFWLFIQPVVVIWFCLGLAVIWLWRARRRRSSGFLVLVFVCVGTILFSNLGTVWLQGLENSHTKPALTELDELAGIIVLGGGFEGHVTKGRGGFAMGESGDRFVEAAALARQFPDLPIIISGGEASFIGETEGDAAIAPRFFARLGVPPEQIVLESQSRNTRENAVYSKQMADSLDTAPNAPWLLVTSAFHMPRSIGCFEQVGMDVVAWPVDYRTSGAETLAFGRDDPLRALGEFSLALRETIGLLVYRQSGYLD